MKFKLIILFILGVVFFSNHPAFAQSAAARKKMAEIDSANASRKYRNTKHYKDSVAKARKHIASSVKKRREGQLDSLKDAKEHLNDSLAAKREAKKDSLAAATKARTDAVEGKQKYKNSKRYRDSVEIVKREKSDALKRKQQLYKDSVANERAKDLSISKGTRKHEADSIKAVRTKYNDSVKLVRKKRTDSLAKAKLVKGKKVETKSKAADAKKQLALEIKFKAKREAYTNQSMLKRRWTPIRRFTQNGFTHFNYYYNANRKMEEANANMLRGTQKENLDSLIRIWPFDPDRDSTLLASDMDSIIRKASVGLQIHDPRVKWANDLLLLMGEAYYYKGNYKSAAATFKYIISNDEETKKAKQGYAGSKEATSVVEEQKGKFDFLKHKSVHNDAIVWLARVYTQMKMIENGQAVLSLLSTDPHMPEDMVGEVAVGRAYGYLSEENYSAASEQLTIAIANDYLPDWLKMRCAFLNAQLKQKDAQFKDAVANYEIALDYFPKLDMDFNARKNIAYCTLMAGGDVGDGIKPLKKVLNDGKYSSYYDQVYFVLGQMSAKAGRTSDAIDYLKKSATTPKATKKQKAISYAALGDVYYGTGSYTNAKNAYDSSAKYASGSHVTDASVAAASQRSKGLAEVSQPTAIIQEQDSLLALADLNKKEQQAIVHKYIRSLEKKLEDSIRSAKDAAENGTAQGDNDNDAGGTTSSWYFGNPSLMQQGNNEFKRKWGNRPLVDNWRRSASVLMSAPTVGASGTDETAGDDDKVTLSENGLPTEESLLAKIPTTAEQKQKALKTEWKAYIALAKAYLKQLDDHVQSLATLDTLDRRYPDHDQKEEDLHMRYENAIRAGKLDKAQELATEFLSKYPTSLYAASMKPKQEDAALASANGGKKVAAYFEETYEMILRHQYTQALSNIDVAKREYTDPIYKKRFQVAEAMSYAAQGKYDMADTLLAKFLAANPSDSLTDWVKQVTTFVKDMRKNGVPSWYNDTIVYKPLATKVKEMKPEPPKPAPPPKLVRPADVPKSYAYAPEGQHYAMFILNSLDSRTSRLKKSMDSLNNARGIHVQVLIDLYRTSEIVITVQRFGTAKEASDYCNSLAADSLFKDYSASEAKPYVISPANYKKLFWEKEISPYANYYTTYYKEP